MGQMRSGIKTKSPPGDGWQAGRLTCSSPRSLNRWTPVWRFRGGAISESVELSVAEAPQSDVGLGRGRLDERRRRLLSVEIGDVVEVSGKRTTVATVRELAPEEEGKEIIRIDGLIRSNAEATIGGKVTVRKAEIHPAQTVELAPVLNGTHKISFGQGLEDLLKRGLSQRPLRPGDVVIVAGIALMGGALPFKVIRTEPQGNVRIAEETVVSLRDVPVHRWEGVGPGELFKAFTMRLSDLVDEFGGELSKLDGETGEQAKSITRRLGEIIRELRGKWHQ